VELVAGDGGVEQYFGAHLALSSDYLLVGAPNGNPSGGSYAGAAYVYDRETLAQLHKFVDPDAAPFDGLGNGGLALIGDTALVGSPQHVVDDVPTGTVFEYDLSTGQLVRQFEPSVTGTFVHYGAAVGVSNDFVVVGAPDYQNPTGPRGRAFVYDRLTGQELHVLTADGDQFGFGVSIAGDLALIGAPSSSQAFAFDLTTGLELFELSPPTTQHLDLFGLRVAASGNYAVVSAYFRTDTFTNQGVLYVFDLTTGLPLLEITANDPAALDYLGTSISIDGDLLLAGARGVDEQGEGSGAAYLFDLASGDQLAKLLADDGAAQDLFGVSCAIEGNLAVVGSRMDDLLGPDFGSVSLFELVDVDLDGVPDPCGVLGIDYCPATVNSTGMPAQLTGRGSPTIGDNNFELLASNVAQNQFGYYIMSMNQGFLAGFAGGMGNLCLAAPIVRFNNRPSGQVLFSGPDGTMSFRPDLTNLPQSTSFLSGQTWSFQCWFRDFVGPMSTHNTSNGLEITFQ